MEDNYSEILKRHNIDKTVKITIRKLSDDVFAKHKIIGPELIKEDINSDICDKIVTEIIESIDINEENAQSLDETKCNGHVNGDVNVESYSCFFCNQSKVGFDNAFVHFQQHIEYYPIQCYVCDEVTVDIPALVKHYQKMHSNVEKGTFIRKPNLKFEEWIRSYLNSQKDSVFSKYPQHYCPACNLPENLNDTETKKRPSKILSHIHKHLLYFPFECSKCKENGNIHRVNAIDPSAVGHVTTKHKEMSSELPTVSFFTRNHSIPKLDEFIGAYLKIFKIEMPKLRKRKRKKKMFESKADPILSNILSQPLVTTNERTFSLLSETPQLTEKILKWKNILSNESGDSPHRQSSLPPQRSILPKMLNANQLNPYLITSPVTYSKSQLSITPTNRLTPQNGLLSSNTLVLLNSNTNQISLSSHLKNNVIKQPSVAADRIVEATIEYAIPVLDAESPLFEADGNYFCVFCSEVNISSKLDACAHYSKHFDYTPVNCIVCKAKFYDISNLINHNEKEHPQLEENMFYYVKQNEKIENWIDEFLNFQQNPEILSHISCIDGGCCPVCERLSTANQLILTNSWSEYAKNRKKEADNHIRHHLRYYSYVCLLCQHEGVKSHFACLDSVTLSHMKNSHGHENTEKIKEYLPKVFAKCQEIEFLEKFIYDIFTKEKLKKNAEESQQNTAELNSNELKEASSVATETVSDAALVKIDTVDDKLRRKLETMLGDHINYAKRTCNDSLRNINPSTPNELNNLLSDSLDNRLINCKWTDKLYSQFGISNGHTQSLPNVQVESNGTPFNSFGVIPPFTMCMHCNIKLNNNDELHKHYENAHPNLTIVSTVPDNKFRLLSLL